MRSMLVTGAAGFIGANFVHYCREQYPDDKITIVDALTYAGNPHNLDGMLDDQCQLVQADINDTEHMMQLLRSHQINTIVHFAAESHVDRSIDGPADFIETNINGTFNLLEAARHFFEALNEAKKKQFRFHHISTDEVFGDLEGTDGLFTEQTPYSPSSPYSASKAASDHLVRAWGRTYGLPVIITNCSNNYGPYHFPEKLIPHVILNAIHGKPLPIYGNGLQIRDWLYVEDHAKALIKVVTEGKIGETYNIGGHNEKTNLEVVESICNLLEELAPDKPSGLGKYLDLITFVKDRPGHDARYAIDASKIERELGWVPQETFDSGLRKTVLWYLDNTAWWERVLSGEYRLERLGE